MSTKLLNITTRKSPSGDGHDQGESGENQAQQAAALPCWQHVKGSSSYRQQSGAAGAGRRSSDVDGETETPTQLAVEGGTNGNESSLMLSQTSRGSNSTEENVLVYSEREVAIVDKGALQEKRNVRKPTMRHGVHKWSRRNGGAKMSINFTPRMRIPTDPVQAAKLISECGVHIHSKMPLETHWKQYGDKEGRLKDTIPDTIKSITGKFAMDSNADLGKKICTDILQKGIRQQRWRLKKEYWEDVKGLTREQDLLLKPDEVEEQSWVDLLDIWHDEHYKAICESNKKNRDAVTKSHTTGSRSFVAHYQALKYQQTKDVVDTSPIAFFKASHTNKGGMMSQKSAEAYTEMVLRKMGPHPEDWIPKTDLEIVEEVLRE